MLISLNWLKDFVAVPKELSPRELALQFTTTTAEVEGVHHHTANFSGLVAARIDGLGPAGGDAKLQQITLAAGKLFTTLSSAPGLKVGDVVAFAPPGAKIGDRNVGSTDPAGRPTEGMIVAWGTLGFTDIGAHAIVLPPTTALHSPIDAALFDDWVIEIDNKSITHRPDCWGHYGIARELAAMLRLPLKPYDVTNESSLMNHLPAIPITIDDPAKCPRYSGLVLSGLRPQPSPLWMQVRLAMCGQRPIDLIVDLTNYIMLELGQPMHAFDAAKMRNIEVATAAPGEKFTTLDGVTRTMPPGTLMIQCDRMSVAIAGVMGGAATEVGPTTETILLESANFDAATIRRAATAMGHRTDAGARFEKSLDPANTVLAIARFFKLAKAQCPEMSATSTLSDSYPAPKQPTAIVLDVAHASRIIGREVSIEEMRAILERLEFRCEEAATAVGSGGALRVTPPSFRATKDIAIDVDLIEEVARFIGYNNIEPILPSVASRYFEPMAEHTLEERTLAHLCEAGEFVEIHDYIWYDDDWNKTLDFDPGECLMLQNPAAANCARLRQSMIPGLLAAIERNRHFHDRLALAEIGSVFFTGRAEVEHSQERRLALVAAQSGKKSESEVWQRLTLALDGWGRCVLNESPRFASTSSCYPWEDGVRVAEIRLGGKPIGRITIVPLALKQRIDERLASWSLAMAEVRLAPLVPLIDRSNVLPGIPRYPQTRLDFSTMTDAQTRYEAIAPNLAAFSHPLLKQLEYVESYQGGSVPTGKRSLLFRATIGHADRTLTEEDIRSFQEGFRKHLTQCGLELRT